MVKYSIGCGLFGGVYSGILRKDNTWRAKTLCTEEAIQAVIQHMMLEAGCEGKTKKRYSILTCDGRKVELQLTIKEKDMADSDKILKQKRGKDNDTRRK